MSEMEQKFAKASADAQNLKTRPADEDKDRKRPRGWG